MTFDEVVSAAYPRIPYLTRIIHFESKEALAVIIWGSALRPHFSGPAYVRSGSKSVTASEEQYQRFIAERSSIVRALLEYRGKLVSVYAVLYDLRGGGFFGKARTTLIDCNQFYVTLEESGTTTETKRYSVPIGRIELSYDFERDTLRLDLHKAGY